MKNKSRWTFYTIITTIINVFILGGCQLINQETSLQVPSMVTTSQTPAGLPAFSPTAAPDEIMEETENDLSDSPLYIESLRTREYPASEIINEQTLDPGANY